MKDFLLDANVVIRFLVSDDEKQGAASKALFEKAERNEVLLHLHTLTVAEVVYVLHGTYRHKREAVANGLLALIQNSGIAIEHPAIVADALRRFAQNNVDFADAWLAAQARDSGYAIASFDRDFDKFKDVRRLEPK